MEGINYDNYYWQNDLVRLRAGRPEDWEEHYRDSFDSKARLLLQYQIELPPTEEGSRKTAEQFSGFGRHEGRLMFTIEDLDGRQVGSLNLNSVNERNGTFHIGIHVGRNHRGKGYGTAAMRVLLAYAFFERRLNKYHASCLDTNAASAAMMKKLGCVQEGLQRQEAYTGGRYHDIILFGLTKDDFVANERTVYGVDHTEPESR